MVIIKFERMGPVQARSRPSSPPGKKVYLVFLVRPVFLVKKIHFVFLFICLYDEIDGIDETDEKDEYCCATLLRLSLHITKTDASFHSRRLKNEQISIIIIFQVGKSSNGRTHDSGSCDQGSNPCFPATFFPFVFSHLNLFLSFNPKLQFFRVFLPFLAQSQHAGKGLSAFLSKLASFFSLA
jgi:hypothetical protein